MFHILFLRGELLVFLCVFNSIYKTAEPGYYHLPRLSNSIGRNSNKRLICLTAAKVKEFFLCKKSLQPVKCAIAYYNRLHKYFRACINFDKLQNGK
jgi:hypothetical protein